MGKQMPGSEKSKGTLLLSRPCALAILTRFKQAWYTNACAKASDAVYAPASSTEACNVSLNCTCHYKMFLLSRDCKMQ